MSELLKELIKVEMKVAFEKPLTAQDRDVLQRTIRFLGSMQDVNLLQLVNSQRKEKSKREEG